MPSFFPRAACIIHWFFGCASAGLLFTQTSCMTRDYNAQDDGQGSDALLVGGAPAGASQFPAVVRLPQVDCTGAKIGPRHILTAAHCTRSLSEGQETTLQSGAAKGSARIARVRVNRVTRHSKADAAVVRIDRDPLELADARLLGRAPKSSDRITLVGYGCTERPMDMGDGGLTSGNRTSAAPTVSATHSTLRYLNGTISTLNGSEIHYQAPTRGGVLGGTILLPGLCKGDSGGPLWVRDGGIAKIAGVNSSFNPSGKSVFVRVDPKADDDIGKWISDQLN